MFLGKTVVHGIYALCYLSRQRPDEMVSASAVAAAVGVPPEHARKILTSLAAAGLVDSVRGRSGGYALARRLQDISMLDALDALNPDAGMYALESRACPVSSHNPCCVQPGLAALREEVRALFANCSLESILGEECRRPSTRRPASAQRVLSGAG